MYGIPAPDVGDRVMAALVLAEGADFDAEEFRAFLGEQPDLGPKQWPSFVRIGAELPRTETFKVIKRQLSAEGTECDDLVCADTDASTPKLRTDRRLDANRDLHAVSRLCRTPTVA